MKLKLTPDQALEVVLDYVERWNKKDSEEQVAEAAQILKGCFVIENPNF